VSIHDLHVPEEMFATFTADPTGVLDKIARIANDPQSPLHESVNRFLATIPRAAVAETCADAMFRGFYGGVQNPDRLARIWFAERLLIDHIYERRLERIREAGGNLRPAPYSTAALSDVLVDSEGLVRLCDLSFDGSRLIRNQFAFTVLSTTSSPNSTCWLLRALYSERIADKCSVRLDPFLFGAVEAFPSVFYKELVYGTPLDWNKVADPKAVDHGRWFSDGLNPDAGITEFCWTPRDNEVHFICEELPKFGSSRTKASRYLHAVYCRESKVITHFDGALRLYTDAELQDRSSQHLRNAGKQGMRVKVFRTDASVARECFSLVARALRGNGFSLRDLNPDIVGEVQVAALCVPKPRNPDRP
jgi:hypothetical protein